MTVQGYETALFYNLDVKRDATASVTLGALQDNGIVTNAPPAAFPSWTDGIGGDGFDVAHDGQAVGSSRQASTRTLVRGWSGPRASPKMVSV